MTVRNWIWSLAFIALALAASLAIVSSTEHDGPHLGGGVCVTYVDDGDGTPLPVKCQP